MSIQGFARNRAIVLGLSMTSMGAQAVIAAGVEPQQPDLSGLVAGDFGAAAFSPNAPTYANLVERLDPQGCDPSGCNFYYVDMSGDTGGFGYDPRDLQTLIIEASHGMGAHLTDAEVYITLPSNVGFVSSPDCAPVSASALACPVGVLDPDTSWTGTLSVQPLNALGYELTAVVRSSVPNSEDPRPFTVYVSGASPLPLTRMTRVEQDFCPFASADIIHMQASGEPYAAPFPSQFQVRLYEDGSYVGSQPDTSAAVPLSIALLLDDSAGVDDATWQASRNAAVAFVQDWASWSTAQGQPMPSFAIYGMASASRLSAYGSDVPSITAALAAMPLLPSGTHVHAALALVSDDLSARSGRRAALVLATGKDSSGVRDHQTLMRQLKQHQVNVYSVVSDASVEPLFRQIAASSDGFRQRSDIDGGMNASVAKIARQLRAIERQAWISPYADTSHRDIAFRSTTNIYTTVSTGIRTLSPVAPGCQSACIATRTMPAQLLPSSPQPISLLVQPSATEYTTLSELVHEYGAVTAISGGGSFDPNSNMIFWNVPPGTMPVVLSYTYAAPEYLSYTRMRFSGYASRGGELLRTCGTSIANGSRVFPTDIGNGMGNFRKHDFLAYERAWRKGTPWVQSSFFDEPLDPESGQIAMGYVTRGHQLLRANAGGAYAYTGGTVPWTSVVAGATAATVQGRSRVLPLNYVPGTPFTVTLSYTSSDAAGAGAIEEVPPAGWTISNISDSGIHDPKARMIRWGVFSGTSSRSVSYTLTPPASATGPVRFEGRVSVDGNDVDFTEAALQSPTSDLILRSGFDS